MRPRQTEPVTGWSSGLRFLWRLLSAWWWPTLILGTAYIALSDYGYYQQYKLNSFEIGIATVGTISLVAFLKASWLLSFYPLVCRARFNGSFLFMAALVTALLMIALISLACVGALQGAEFPHVELPWLFAGTYVFFTFALWLGFMFSDRVLGNKLR